VNKTALLTIVAFFAMASRGYAQTASPAPSASLAPSPAPAASASPAATVQPAPMPAATPIDTPVFSAPAGWKSMDMQMNVGGLSVLHSWIAPQTGRTGDNMILGFMPNPTGQTLAQGIPALRNVMRRMAGTANVTDHPENLCEGKRAGWMFSVNISMGTISAVEEQVYLAGPHDIFMAQYTRIKGRSEDPAARHALDTLCTKS
jgi:hypothetical protein